MSLPSTVPARRAAPLLFFSGACALVYQVAWLRELRDVFGASTASSAAVLAVFMGGLGAGGLLLSRRIANADVPLRFYAHLELGIGVTACVTPFLVMLARGAYLAMGGQTTLGVGGATIVRLLLTALVLGVPTVLMGGTLPAAARAATPPGDRSRRAVAILYGTNTIGAVCGALAANFLLLEIFGTRLTLWMAGLLNLLVGLFARMIARLPGIVVREKKKKKKSEAADIANMPAWFPPLAAGVSGFVFLLMEIVWYRMLAPLLGGSSYTFGLILAVALAGIGLGGVAYALRKPRPTLALFGLTCALEAACLILPYALGDRIAFLAILLRPLGQMGFGGYVAGWTALLSIVVFPTAFVAGYQFPLTIALFGVSDRAQVSRHVAIAYAANTVGSIAGSLAGGFGLLPLLTAPGCWRLATMTLIVMGVASSALGFVRLGDPRPQLVGSWMFALAALGMLRGSLGPTAAWRHSPIGAGRIDPGTIASKNKTQDFLNSRRRSIVWEVDGVESTVGLSGELAYDFVVSGKSDGNALGDSGTQVMSGLVGVALRPDARTSLVVGLGTGSTAGWLGVVPEMESVDVVEIEPAIHYVAEKCAAVNQHVLENPKVHLRYGDAREELITTTKTYDLVFSEPSNPYRAGVSSFFTLDFYRSIKSRLSPSGVFLQWLQLYEVDGEVVRSVLATIGTVFPHVSIWETIPGDVLLVATNDPIVIDVERLRESVKQEPLRSAMRFTWYMDDAEGFLAHHLANDGLLEDVRTLGVPANTDDRNSLEYAFARYVGREGLSMSTNAWALTKATKRDRPRVQGNVDWGLVEERRLLTGSAMGVDPPEAFKKLADAMSRWQGGALGATHAAWKAWGKDPSGYYERRMVTEALAEAGEEQDAKAAIDAWVNESPGEAHLFRARLLGRTHHGREAADELRLGLVAYRDDPWIDRTIVRRVFNVAATLALDPALMPTVLEALGTPFAVRAMEGIRLATRTKIVPVEDARCVEMFAALEPHVPWDETNLTRRRDCYRNHNAPLAAAADADLQRFFGNAPSKL